MANYVEKECRLLKDLGLNQVVFYLVFCRRILPRNVLFVEIHCPNMCLDKLSRIEFVVCGVGGMIVQEDTFIMVYSVSGFAAFTIYVVGVYVGF